MFGAGRADPRIQVTLQYGNNRENIVLIRSDEPEIFESLRNRARALVNKYGNQSSADIINLHLFRHNYNSPVMLQHIASVSQLDNGCVVEIIVADKNEGPTKPHVVEGNTYLVPTFCDYCGEMLAGVIKQGVRCLHCRCNFHKRCYNAPRNNCVSNAAVHPSSSQVGLGSAELAKTSSGGLPHTLAEHNYKNFTLCKICNNLLVGIVKQGLKCRDCGVNVHKKCAKELLNNCTLADHSISRMSIADTQGSIPKTDSLEHAMEDDSCTNDNIPLFRLPGQASSRATSQPKVEGWMIHFELSDPERRLKHYWILADNSINMYHEYNEGVGVNPSRSYRIIPLHEILAITEHTGPPILSKYPPHCFEIRTTSNQVFCVGENLHAYSTEPPKKLPRYLSIRPPSNTQLWFQALKEALQPPVSYNDPPNMEPALDFSALYQVLSERPLGSGQFGTVYSAVHRSSGKEVAVKVISKERFAKKGSGVDSMRTEVAILQRTCHAGIVRLEFMCETKDKIFVVMEKLSGDMLEMILSQATGRLNERITKFLIVQILSALKYLHDQGIAHCDLKPENVLLSEINTSFPQTKICDFGYARFIPEAQFRKTIVGTPAYLPPEVLQKRGYNKSLDMWSVGVIIYVTLSGTFPFNEGDEIASQIQNADFMFPTDPWNDISPLAIDLIQRLLRVELDLRLTIEQCLAHSWLKGEQLYTDLRTLEARLDCARYLTSPADDLIYADILAKKSQSVSQR
ncbi:unnamed protein product [Auanema sp. JU1783]|nr:unnamed protein product [Auanema sp. JU1783]